ncbi:columbamine O-methyltransferase-like [Magnolia sinica]|uniref:columbamine O-methyltransferase-like n=1 Tax=Magnolia sinica TaxID=86752 RepID=UPI002658144A|nr:columbamine O-methyltransferase-like [Magnolia sinica]
MEESKQEPKLAGDEAIAAQVQLWKHIRGFIDSAALRCMIQLGLPDLIHDQGGPTTFDQIAIALPILTLNKDCLYRILRYLVHMNLLCVVEENGQYKYALTPASKLLVQGQEKSLAPFVMFMIRPESMQLMQHISESLKGPMSLLQRFLGIEHEKDKWNWVGENVDSNAEFVKVMMGHTSLVIEEVVRRMEKSRVLDGVGTLVDVGGNTGQVAGAIAKAFPHVKCRVLELAHVVDSISEPPTMVSIVKGDMFDSIPQADVVFMKSILHDWNDEDCIKILRKCKEAIPSKGGKVILVDIVLDTDATDGLVGARLCMEMMMLLIGGKERTKEEWNKLIESTGFSSYKITYMEAMESIIEIYP